MCFLFDSGHLLRLGLGLLVLALLLDLLLLLAQPQTHLPYPLVGCRGAHLSPMRLLLQVGRVVLVAHPADLAELQPWLDHEADLAYRTLTSRESSAWAVWIFLLNFSLSNCWFTR